MQTYVITPKTAAEQQQLAQFLEHSQLSAHILSEEEKEDFAMLKLMGEGSSSETVSEEEVMKVLRSREG